MRLPKTTLGFGVGIVGGVVGLVLGSIRMPAMILRGNPQTHNRSSLALRFISLLLIRI